MPPMQKIQDSLYRNWVRAVLGLYFIQEGLRDFVDRVVKLQHLKTLQNVRCTSNNPAAQCTRCPLAGILPAHAGNKCILKNGRHCNCRRRSNRHCPFCSNMYDDIIRLHRYSDPNWETDAGKWFTDHWQFAKCYLTTTSKQGDNSAIETDVSGLLSIIINARFFQSEISCVINAPYDDFCQARSARNEIIHSSTLELTDTQVARYLQMMIIVLEDAKTLLNDPLAKAAVENIKLIQNDRFVITTESESKAIDAALKALEAKKLECMQDIEKKEEESLDAIQSAKDKAEEDLKVVALTSGQENIEKVTVDLKNVEKRVNTMEEAVANVNADVSYLKVEITDIIERLTELEETQKQHQERRCYLQKKQALKRDLIEQYEEYLTSDVSPFLPEEDVHLSKVFVPVKMVLQNHVDAAIHSIHKPTVIDSFHDVVYTDGTLACNVLVSGDAGTGKTTFCKALICKWCESQSADRYDKRLTLQTIIQGDCSKTSRVADLETMKTFEFLFYVSLRHTFDERFIEDMICNQLLYPNQNNLLLEILAVEPEVCLVVLDGLDEWSPARSTFRPLTNGGFPKARFKYTKITTSRPWKIASVRPNSGDVDTRVKLEGIGKTSADQLTKCTVLELNKKFKTRMFFWKFQDEVQRMKLNELCKTPILLKFLVCLWFDDQSLGKYYCGIYSAIINVMIKHANERFTTDHRFQTLKSNLVKMAYCLPPCFDGKVACQEIHTLLVSLSRLAFHGLFSESRASSLVFQQDDIKKHGLTEEELELSKKIGLLSVSQVPGRSVINRYQCFSFPHKSVQEFLSALYISVILETNSFHEKIKEGFNSQTVVLQNAVVFKFLCGLDHSKATILSKHITHVIDGECKTKTHRTSIRGATNFEGYSNSQCSPTVTEVQDVLYECIMEGRASGLENLKLHISDLDIDINTKIRTCCHNLDMTSLVTLRIHDKLSAVENDFLNVVLKEECVSLTNVVLKNISLTIQQFRCILQKTVLLKMDNVDFCDVSDFGAYGLDIMSEPVRSKIEEIAISNLKLCCIGFNRLISFVLSNLILKKLTLKNTDCASPCVCYHWDTNLHHVTTGELPLLKEICLDNIPISKGSFREAWSIFRSAESVVLRNLTMSQNQMDEILANVADSSKLKKLSIRDVMCSLSCSRDEDSLDYILVPPSSPLPPLQLFRLSDVNLTHDHMEMIISVLQRASRIEDVSISNIKCDNHNASKESCPFDDMIEVLHQKAQKRLRRGTLSVYIYMVYIRMCLVDWFSRHLSTAYITIVHHLSRETSHLLRVMASSPETDHVALCEKVGGFYGGYGSSTIPSQERCLGKLPIWNIWKRAFNSCNNIPRYTDMNGSSLYITGIFTCKLLKDQPKLLPLNS